MNDLIIALQSPYASFLRYAFLVGIVSSVTFGIIGTFVVTKRISNIAGAISHSILGGIGAAVLFSFDPSFGATAAALVSAVIIGFVSMYAKEREDTVISAIWAIGMAIGMILMSRTPGYTASLTSYLFGNILLISGSDFLEIMLLNALIIIVCFSFYSRLLAICFDEEVVRLRGIRTGFYYILLLSLVALATVMLVRIVGIIMVIALITLPSAIAGYFSNRLFTMIVYSILLCAFFNVAGLCISFIYNLPSGPCIVLLAGAVYILTAIISAIKRKA